METKNRGRSCTPADDLMTVEEGERHGLFGLTKGKKSRRELVGGKGDDLREQSSLVGMLRVPPKATKKKNTPQKQPKKIC